MLKKKYLNCVFSKIILGVFKTFAFTSRFEVMLLLLVITYLLHRNVFLHVKMFYNIVFYEYN